MQVARGRKAEGGCEKRTDLFPSKGSGVVGRSLQL